MANVNNLLKEAIEQVESAGITVGKINPNLGINTRAKTFFGTCKKVVKTYDYEIEINHQLLKVNKKKLMNTLIHEVLHTCKGCMNHGKTWVNYANKMNDKFGYDISRATSYEKVGIERPKAKYTVECIGCGNQTYRQQRSKLITQVDKYRCRCGSKLKLV